MQRNKSSLTYNLSYTSHLMSSSFIPVHSYLLLSLLVCNSSPRAVRSATLQEEYRKMESNKVMIAWNRLKNMTAAFNNIIHFTKEK